MQTLARGMRSARKMREAENKAPAARRPACQRFVNRVTDALTPDSCDPVVASWRESEVLRCGAFDHACAGGGERGSLEPAVLGYSLVRAQVLGALALGQLCCVVLLYLQVWALKS